MMMHMRWNVGWIAGGVLAIGLVCATGCGREESAAGGEDAVVARSVSVAVEPVREMEFEETLFLQGTVESRMFALIPAKVGGTVEKLIVEEGTMVEAGQALCELDHENLARAVETRRQELAVATSSLEVGRAQEDRARADLLQAEKDYKRFGDLVADDAVSIQKYEEVETAWKSAMAVHRVAQAQVTLAEARLKQAETALAIAERDLDDATVRAPISGVISVKYRELGEMVESGSPVFRIDNPDCVEFSVFAPADDYTLVRVGETRMRVRVNQTALGELPVSYKSPTVEERFRTFEVKARMERPEEAVVAGSMAEVELILKRSDGRGVPSGAVLARGGQSVVFLAEGGKARKCAVETGMETDGMVQIVSELPEGALRVITKGQDLVNDGDAITVVGE